MTDPTARVTRDGKTLSARVWALLDDAGKAANVPIRVVQGSWSGGVAASAGTHQGAGAFDLSVSGMDRGEMLTLVNALRKRNVAAWLRSPEYGWTSTGPHIHGIVIDEPGLSTAARSQVVAYARGLNGLANAHRDPFARPAQTHFAMPEEAAVPAPAKTMSPWPEGAAVIIDRTADGKPVKVAAGGYVELGRIILPADGRFLPSAAIRLPAGTWARWRFARIGWGGDPDGHDEIGCALLAPAPDGLATSHTPAGHPIKGGGPLAFEIKVYGATSVALPTVKLMASRLA